MTEPERAPDGDRLLQKLSPQLIGRTITNIHAGTWILDDDHDPDQYDEITLTLDNGNQVTIRTDSLGDGHSALEVDNEPSGELTG